MKQVADKSTIDLFQTEKRRGRPTIGAAKTDAQRMREYRQRLKQRGCFVELVRPEDVQARHDSAVLCSNEILQLRKERDDALKLAEEYRNALHQLKGEI